MKDKSNIEKSYFKFLRIFTRVLASLFAALELTIIIGEIVGDIGPITFIGVMVGVFGFLLPTLVVLSFFKERLGGILMVSVGILYAVFIYMTAGTNRLIAASAISGIYWLPGILFVILNNKHMRKS